MDAKIHTLERVVAVTIMHGNRWNFLSQTITSILKDAHVCRLIIVDNGSQNEREIREGVAQYGNRVKVIRHEKNLGSAGGFSAGIAAAREEDADFVYLSDDDMVPEDGFVGKYLALYDLFPHRKVVLCGNRLEILDNANIFYRKPPSRTETSGTFFEVFSLRKLYGRIVQKKSPFIPIIPNGAFVYGGAFIPMEAVRKAPLPDKDLFLYGDDVEYSWNIKKLGYESYVCFSPKIKDIDFTFAGNQSHLTAQFDKNTASFKVYYRMRNMVRLSRKHSKQSFFVLFFNIIAWTLGLFVLGFFKKGLSKVYVSRVTLLTKAVIAGYAPKTKIARDTEALFGF